MCSGIYGRTPKLQQLLIYVYSFPKTSLTLVRATMHRNAVGFHARPCRPKYFRCFLVLFLLTALAGCGNESPDKADLNLPPAPVAAPQTALELNSLSTCALDTDCAAGNYCFQGQCVYECDAENTCAQGGVCTPRGRCEFGQSGVHAQQVGPNLRIVNQDTKPQTRHASEQLVGSNLRVVNTPETVFHVDRGQREVTFNLQLNAPAPAEGLIYRIERSDDPDSANRARRTNGSSTSVNIKIPVGLADSELAESAQVKLKIFTALGNYQVALIPQYPVGGSYIGTAEVATFGNTGLPLEFQIVTRPDNVPLARAEQAWLVLPVGPAHLFSPVYSRDNSIEYAASELIYDDFVEKWVAKFEYAFDLTQSSMVASTDAKQVRRALRFQLETMGANTILGEFSDTWAGIYEARSTSGVRNLQDVKFEGTISADRYTAGMKHKDLPLVQHPTAAPGPLPPPPISACTNDVFDVTPIELHGEELDCANIASTSGFRAASPADQARCAIAVAHHALSGETTGGQIRAFLDGDQANSTGQSFAEFMEDCAAGTNGICRAKPEVLCGRQLVAHAYRSQQDDSTLITELVNQYDQVTREAYLGLELSAFGTDARLRLEWLKTSDYPAVVASAVKSLNEQLLNEWKDKVLEVHLQVLQGQFDPSGLEVLSRQVLGQESADRREQILTDMTQSWRGSLDSLTLATTRWHTLLQGDSERAEKRDYVSARLFDLYLAAGILKNLNLSANAGYLSARLAGGFSSLLRELNQLSLPFDKLIYARDAEVVINTSVDPRSGNETLLSERKDDALQEIARGHQSVLEVLERAQAEALSETQLRDRMANEINDLRDGLVELCGIPAGCSASDFRTDPLCSVRVAAGECGFTIDKNTEKITSFGPGEQSISEAGRALLAVADAAQNIGIANEELRALMQRAELEFVELQAFSKEIKNWNEIRLEGVKELEENIAQRENLRNETIKLIFDNIAQRAANRKSEIEDSQKSFDEWDQIRMAGVDEDIGLMVRASAARAAADGLRNSAESVKDFAEAAVAGFPTVSGLSNDLSAPARLAVLLGKASSVLAMRTAAVATDATAVALEIAREKAALLRDAELARLEDANALSDAISADELETLKEEMLKAEKLSAAELERLKEVIEIAQAYREAELTHRRDLDQFRQRRLSLFQKLTTKAGLDLRVQQAHLQYNQAVAVYLSIVQRAQLQNAKFQDLLRQREQVNRLVGSPAVIFGRANQLTQAELRLERAKDKLMDWLVALEYYAVRPFMDQRLSILLARNTYQLEKIAEELKRLERSCGGPTNAMTSVLSVKNDLLGITHPILDPVNETALSPDERFREILSLGYVPVDKRVRYSTDETIGSLMARDPNILAATFFIDLSDFANLELTCNAKIANFAVNLIGDIGEARPTVSLLYDGTSKLRSCQPGIDDYVELFGPDTTNYGRITHLRTVGRSTSPVASINGFSSGTQTSETLAGLPLASQYTLLINKQAGENHKIDWSKLEDIEFQLTYAYQDIFPVGQCE